MEDCVFIGGAWLRGAATVSNCVFLKSGLRAELPCEVRCCTVVDGVGFSSEPNLVVEYYAKN